MENVKEDINKNINEIKYININEIKTHPKNPRIHPDSAINKLVTSIEEFGFTNPVLLSKDGMLLAGHARLKASQKAGLEKVPAIFLDLEGSKADAYLIADNKIQEGTEWDFPVLKDLLEELDTGEIDMELTGFDLDELEDLMTAAPPEEQEEQQKGSLYEKFLFPPFSILDSQKGQWQDRRRAWLELGIKSELGRDIDNANVLEASPDYFKDKGVKGGATVFDPVLCEVAYRWFCPDKGTVLDPFAGGSVRGVVASKLGLAYTGIELRPEQVEANQQQAEDMELKPKPVWINGDSKDIKSLAANSRADFVFSCPPYADLEKYSDNPKDLSNMPYSSFLEAYRHIVMDTVSMLKENRFACFVVGDIRDKKTGLYRNFVAHTIEAFQDAGAMLYNEGIYVSPAGTLPIRVSSWFGKFRKFGKQHQNFLVFYKGDTKQIQNVLPEINMDELKEFLDEQGGEA